MAKRHQVRAGDWSSVAVRLDEIISAHSGEDPFEEALTLLGILRSWRDRDELQDRAGLVLGQASGEPPGEHVPDGEGPHTEVPPPLNGLQGGWACR